MGQYSQILVGSSKPLLNLAEKMLDGVGPHNAARKPTWGIGGEIINCNHAAFIYGHLALYPARLLGMIGSDPSPLAAPAGFDELFAAGKPCHDDPHGSIYPPLEKITSAFFRNMNGVLDTVGKMNDADLLRPNPNERMAKNFPTIGTGVTFMLTSHVAMHLGQMSTWRRAMGLPSAM